MMVATISSPVRNNPGWLVVLAAFFGVMVSFGSLLVFTFSVFVKPLTAEFGWSREAVSGAFGAAAMSVAVASPILGRLLDRFGPRWVILPCMTVFGVGIASLSLLTPSIYHLYGTFVLLGIVGNGTTQMGYSRAVSSWFEERRGMALALVVAGVGVGSIVLPPLAQRLITEYGWRTTYAVLGALVLTFGLPLTAFVRERPAHTELGGRAQHAGAEVRHGLRSRAFWVLVAVLFLGSITVNGALTHFSALLTDRGVAPQHAAFALSALGLASLSGRILVGHLLDHHDGRMVAMVLLAGVAAGIALLSRAASVHEALLSAVLIGLGLGGEADITPYLLTRYFGLRSFSTLYGFTWTAYAIAGATGPVLMGKVFDVSGSYTSLLIILSGAAAAAGALNLFLPRYPAKLAT